MNINGQQLTQYLNRYNNIILFGNEPYLLNEYANQIIAAYPNHEIIRIYIESPNDWQDVLQQASSYSLFNAHQLLDIRYSKDSFDQNAKKILSELFQLTLSDTVVMIRAASLNKTSLQSWLKPFNDKVLTVQAWPLKAQALKAWAKQKLNRLKIDLSNLGYQVLIDFTEGNMLACSQAIEKLSMLYNEGTVNDEQLAACLALQANFDVFQLVDTCLLQNTSKSLTILEQLKSQGVEPSLVLWAFTKEIRLLSLMSFAIEQGSTFNQEFKNHRLWDSKKALYKTALDDGCSNTFHQLLCQSRKIDDAIKGLNQISPWILLSRLTAKLSRLKEKDLV